MNGNDRLYGGNNNDKLYGGNHNDKLYGDAGNDRLYMDTGNDFLDGGSGTDWLYVTGSAKATVNLANTKAQNTGYGRDTIKGIEHISGGSGADKFTGSTGNNTIKGNNGNDTLYGMNGNDKLYGGNNNDVSWQLDSLKVIRVQIFLKGEKRQTEGKDTDTTRLFSQVFTALRDQRRILSITLIVVKI